MNNKILEIIKKYEELNYHIFMNLFYDPLDVSYSGKIRFVTNLIKENEKFNASADNFKNTTIIYEKINKVINLIDEFIHLLIQLNFDEYAEFIKEIQGIKTEK